MEWMCSDAFFASALPHLKSRIDVFSEASQWLNPLWVNDVSLTQEALTELGLETDVVANVLQYLIWRLESVSTWTRDAVEAEIRWVADSLGLKLKNVMPLVFLVLSGTRQAISAFDLAVLLGPNRTRARVRAGLEAVGGVSKKGLKRLEKSYQEALQSIDTAKDAN
jgi:glutamyl-tRNA synthetase